MTSQAVKKMIRDDQVEDRSVVKCMWEMLTTRTAETEFENHMTIRISTKADGCPQGARKLTLIVEPGSRRTAG